VRALIIGANGYVGSAERAELTQAAAAFDALVFAPMVSFSPSYIAWRSNPAHRALCIMPLLER
jgi:hypothetical protein